MLFSSTIFLFYFLPVLLLFYFLAPSVEVKNYVLLIFSFIFFAWGGITFTLLLLGSIVFNFLIGLGIERSKPKRSLILGITGNLALLLTFKYANFITFNCNAFFHFLQLGSVPITQFILPIGISFYTFHSISYLVDVYYKKVPAQTNVFSMALYIVLFTQLVAGPIVRYSVFAPQLTARKINSLLFIEGIERFIIGLGKKVIIANTLARFADAAFTQDTSNMSTLLCWMGAIAYTFQIYFDFSGYSDMAIGLSKLFGFNFPENFNLPYIASSIKDFWKRWHISLSSFFRDYLYIPLGGNKKGNARTYFNLILVFLLTGFWHGANYTFIIWGVIHGFFLLLERLGFEKILLKLPQFISSSYTFLIVVLAWIPFRADNMGFAWDYYKNLFPNTHDLKLNYIGSFFTTDLIVVSILAILLAFNIHTLLHQLIQKLDKEMRIMYPMKAAYLIAILFLCAMYLISGTYNPFIYYQF
jgi:alginate O-acetyltransferase complex protein AlgI